MEETARRLAMAVGVGLELEIRRRRRRLVNVAFFAPEWMWAEVGL